MADHLQKTPREAAPRPRQRGVLQEVPGVFLPWEFFSEFCEGSAPAVLRPVNSRYLQRKSLRGQRGRQVATIFFDGVRRRVPPAEDGNAAIMHSLKTLLRPRSVAPPDEGSLPFPSCKVITRVVGPKPIYWPKKTSTCVGVS